MKKLKLSIFLVVAIISAVLYSCKQDDFSESDAMKLQVQLDKQRAQNQDTLTTSAYRVSYTVNVVDASLSTLKSTSATSAITGAVVKLVQDTTILKQTVDASGMVTFTNLKPGNANVNITLPSYSQVNYTVNLSQNSINGGRQFSNIIPLIPISGTTVGKIQGKVIFESDLTNNAPEAVPAGTRVIAMVSANSSALPSTGSNGIISISYDSLALSAVTKDDGTFEMNVPTTLRGLDYDIIVPDFTVSQKLLQNTYNNRDTSGVLSILTNFGNSFQSASTVTTGNPVIITVGAPDYTYTQATATAVIDNGMSIDYVHDANVGKYYSTYNTYYYTVKNTNPDGSNATIKINIDGYGHASGTVSNSGSGFPSTIIDTISLPYIAIQAKAVVTSITGSAIASYQVVTGKQGLFYSTENIRFTKHTGSGTGTITELPNINYPGPGDIMSFSTAVKTLATAIGSGFAVGDSLILTVDPNKNNPYKFKLFLSTGSVTAINITNEGAHYINGKVDVLFSEPSNISGTRATASATVTDGKISSINIINSGSGYTTAPTISIVNKAEKSQAKFTATVSNGKITAISPASSGNGYLSAPSVTITSAIPSGSGASAYATVSGGAVSLTLVNQGNGYTGNLPSSSKSYSPPSVNVKGNGTTIINIDLGTGKRTIEQ